MKKFLSIVLLSMLFVGSALSECIKGDCKHMGALLVYCNSEIVAENGPTDEACYWNRRSKIRYKGGKEMEELLNIKEKDKCPVVTFDPPTEEKRLRKLEVMEEAGNTNCPLYKLFQMKFEPPRAPTEEVMLPKWVETNVFKPIHAGGMFQNLSGSLKQPCNKVR